MIGLVDLLLILIGLVIANYVYQFFGKKDYERAFDNSFKQATALFCVALAIFTKK